MSPLSKIIRNNDGVSNWRFSTIIFILLIVVTILLTIKVVPVKVRAMKFDDKLQDIVQPDLMSNEKLINRSEESMVVQILQLAEELGLPTLNPKTNVRVKKLSDERYAATVSYKEIVSLPGYTLTLPFEFTAIQPK